MAMRRLVAVLAMGLTAGSHGLQVAAQATPPAPRPAQAATPATEQSAIAAACEKDQRRLLDLLGIKELRHPADNDPKSPYVTNYEESKAKVCRDLPDPLKLKNGKPVTSAKMWWSARRPEIVADFDREILGETPVNLPKVTWEVVSTTQEKFGDLPVTTKRLAGHVDNSAYPKLTVTIDLILVTPANAAGPVPVMLELAFPAEFKVALERPRPETVTPGMGYYGQAWQDQVLARGWGIAVLSPNSYQADNGAGLTEGIIGLAAKGKPRGLEDWGVLKAWAWGASRALDYFETDKAVDARQVGIQGHSRMGKAALVTMAYDQRFAICYSSSSGEGGAKLYRHIFGEQITDLAAPREYHWMDGNFLKYAGPMTPGDLPVDNHELIALAAPRPVFIGGGSSEGDGYANKNGDAWADPTGMFLAEAAAGPVYRLLGKKDLGTATMPPIGTALIDGDLGFRQHPDGHTPAPNWATFLEFASRYLRAPGDAH
jgi:hypothetical protein